MKKLSILLMLMFLIGACSPDFQFILPKGPKGEKGDKGDTGNPGQSAYELWVDYVTKGAGKELYKGNTELYDFYVYITGAKGEKGDQGPQGIPGINGLNGIDGKSAYDLWIEDVLRGLTNPHDDAGGDWPISEIALSDFWKYLRGRDGIDGEGEIIVDPGKPGGDIVIILGKPNVIAQYQNQDHSEYVSWEDGSVTYKVYDDAGNLVGADVIVKGLPGMPPDIEFTTNAAGEFKIPKELLPKTGTIKDRFGVTQSVTYINDEGDLVDEESAHNTYVPQKVEVRLTITETAPNYSTDGYGGHGIVTYHYVQRKVSNTSEWERIPVWLGDLNQRVIAYKLSDPNDPTSYNELDITTILSNSLYNITGTVYTVVTRPTVSCNYILPAYQASQYKLWDGSNLYFNVVLNSYYGESPHANIVVKVPPIQMMPLIKEVKTYGYLTDLAGDNYVQRLEATFDTSGINYSLFFGAFEKIDITGIVDYTLYQPTLVPEATIRKTPTFKMTIIKPGAPTTANVANLTLIKVADLDDPPVSFIQLDGSIYINSAIQLSSGNNHFRAAGINIAGPPAHGHIIGFLRENPAGTFYIESSHAVNFPYANIPITHTP